MKPTTQVIDRETRLLCVSLVAHLENVQEMLDALERTSIFSKSLKKAGKELKNALEPVIKNWYEQNLTEIQAQEAFAKAGKDFQDAIKAVCQMPVGMWQFVPDLLSQPVPLSEGKTEQVKAMVSAYFASPEMVGEASPELLAYIKNLCELSILDYFAQPAAETAQEIAQRVFEYYFKAHQTTVNAPLAENFAKMFVGFSL